MIRKIINIDAEKCNGCGLCAKACHEGAIEMIDGKASLTREAYCDGLGNCLPVCPTGAISFEERETLALGAASGKRPDWPIQLKLVSPDASRFNGAHLLVSADCASYVSCNFAGDFLSGRTVVIGCPKLDNIDYSEKLKAIIETNNIKDITLVIMEVPCCGGLKWMLSRALGNGTSLWSVQESSPAPLGIPCRVITLAIDGRVLKEESL
ncbi:MAG: 4Fe-4S binding protein [Treponema sp.]|nr:4Fe-4S binding protein [Treponema sp.]